MNRQIARIDQRRHNLIVRAHGFSSIGGFVCGGTVLSGNARRIAERWGDFRLR
ncbi:MAG: hypothetical protein IKE64_11635 [Thermoguttaceae bacterium]|nr:hypothetical protein [Thermoguttaceae bacterium]